jgi:hypothetical protein
VAVGRGCWKRATRPSQREVDKSRDKFGNTALLTACAGLRDHQREAEATVQYLLEFGGASIAEVL